MKIRSYAFAALALSMGLASCNNDNEAINGTTAELLKGEPTSMQFIVSMPHAPKTYASTDPTATDDEIELRTVTVLIYRATTLGTFEYEAAKNFTIADFEPVTGTPDTYKLKDASKISTTTGKVRLMVAMNYPGVAALPTSGSLTDLDSIVYTITSVDDLIDDGFAMFSVIPVEANLVTDASQNTVQVPVKRMVAKVTVQEKIVRSSGKIMSEGGELTNLKFALGNLNRSIYAKQQWVGSSPNVVVQDKNWSSYTAPSDFFTISDYTLSSPLYQDVNLISETNINSLSTAYAPENTAETCALNGENMTYISVRAQYAPKFFSNADGTPKADNTDPAKTFWTVGTTDGAIRYFDAVNDATIFEGNNAGSKLSDEYTDGLCYFRAYINKSGAVDPTIPGNKVNAYDVLRNNYYRAVLSGIKAPGYPTDKGDIKEDTSLDIEVIVNPWQPVEDEYDL